MNLMYVSSNRQAHDTLKGLLDGEKINYKVISDDENKIAFKVKTNDVDYFQNDMVTNIMGSRIPGMFYRDSETSS